MQKRLRITSAGKVGINSEGTAAYLTIRDSEDGGSGNNGSGVLRFSRRNGSATNDVIFYAVHDGSDGVSALRLDVGNSERFRITSGGLVGINTADPAATLEVASGGTASLNIVADNDNDGSNNDSLISFRTNGNGGTAKAVIKYDESETNFGIEANGTRALSIDTSQRLLIGATSTHGINAQLQVRNDGNGHNIEVLRSADSANPPRLWMGKSRGSAASPSAVNDDDTLGEVRGRGYDGSAYREAASVAFVADATPGSSSCPGRIEFYTEDANSNSFTERLRIDSVGTFHFKNGMMIENGSTGTTARNGTQNVDLDAGMVRYYSTASTGTWKPNFRVSSSVSINSLMGTSDVISPTMIVAKGATSHYADTIQVDGSDVTPEWLGGAPTDGGGSGTFDVYSYTIIKTGNAAFKAFGSVSTYE